MKQTVYSRDYRDWLATIMNHPRLNNGFYPIIRHDVDYDIPICHMMMEQECTHSVQERIPVVVYFDVHSDYNLDAIKDVIDDFKNEGFLFGLHINIAYDEMNQPIVERLREDKEKLESLGIKLHSAAGHFYSVEVAGRPKPSNKELEELCEQTIGLPSFQKAFFGNGHPNWKLGDGGGILALHPQVFMSRVTGGKGFFSFHPSNFDLFYDVIYTKIIGRSYHPDHSEIRQAQQDMAGRLTPYLATETILLPHLDEAIIWLQDLVTMNYRRLFRILDAGCGIGLLGAHLMRFNNVKYMGCDINSEYIFLAQEFMNRVGYAPMLFRADIFSDTLPDADVLVYLGAEDCPCDYGLLLEIGSSYEYVLLTVMSKEGWLAAKSCGKEYIYIDEEDFDAKIQQDFHILAKSKAKRILYFLKNKEI